VTIPATVPQGSEIPEGLMNNPVYTLETLFVSGMEMHISCTNLATNNYKFIALK
jgi:hypothetical protein